IRDFHVTGVQTCALPICMRIDDVLALTVPSQPALSPDGSRLVYVLGGVDAEADRATSALWIVQDGTARALTHGTSDTAPVFSPKIGRAACRARGSLWASA